MTGTLFYLHVHVLNYTRLKFLTLRLIGHILDGVSQAKSDFLLDLCNKFSLVKYILLNDQSFLSHIRLLFCTQKLNALIWNNL